MDLGKESYKIEIERGLLPHIGEKIRKLTKAQKIAVITDNHVQAIYGDKIRESLQQGDFHVRIIEMPAGEENKNIHVLEGVYNELCDFNLSRDDAIVTFSGGVPGDLGGFAAASYMRGVPFFQVPTTILAQIDSSVGGKVAIDLPGGKNLAGAFYQPKGVFIDPDLLDTLPTRYVHDGLAEALKYGCIGEALGGIRVAVGIGDIRLDVVNGGAVHQVGAPHDEDGADVRPVLDGFQLDAGQPQRIGSEGRAGGKYAHPGDGNNE